MPHFNKNIKQLKTRLDKWLYFIKNLEELESIPTIFQDDVFEKAFEKAEIAKYSTKERNEYEESLKVYRDLKGVIDTAYEEGKLEGIIQVAKLLKENGVAIDIIVKTTGLTQEQIDAI